MERILVYHTAAIGDSVLATPVSISLKKAYPNAKITLVAHESVIPLLQLCPGYDAFIPYTEEKGTLDIRGEISNRKPDLVVDLSGSNKSLGHTVFTAKKVLRYKKNPDQHAVENYLDTVGTVCDTNVPPVEERFPSLFPTGEQKDKIRKQLPQEGRRFLALVPGVGALRPHRAWPEDSWIALAKHILWEKDHALVLVGGADERTLCSRIAEKIGEFCYNFAGKLNLVETASLLSLCDGTVAGDTGPGHISAAVGTPVVGLYGPTTIERSGPYGYDGISVTVTDKCKCLKRKDCSVKEGSGACMKDIPAKLVYGNLSSLFPWNQI